MAQWNFDCDKNEIWDEFHFLLKCPKFYQERLELFSKLSGFCELESGDYCTMVKLMHYYGDIE